MRLRLENEGLYCLWLALQTLLPPKQKEDQNIDLDDQVVKDCICKTIQSLPTHELESLFQFILDFGSGMDVPGEIGVTKHQ